MVNWLVNTLPSCSWKSSQGQTKVFSFKDFLGVTEEKQLLDDIESAEANIGETIDRKIQNVPEIMLRNADYEEYFKPRELSIGPIHAASPKLFKKELKLKLAAHFLKKCGRLRDILLGDLRSRTDDIRRCFDLKIISTYSDTELVWLVFLDGCAMLGFIDSYMNQRLNQFNISNGQATLIQQDLFLLENQIPFLILEVCIQLLTRLSESEVFEVDFHRFIILVTNTTFPRDSTEFRYINLLHFSGGTNERPVHLLDLLRKVHLIEYTIPDNFFKKLLSRVATHISGAMKCFKKSREQHENWTKKQSFRNVQELKAAGIKFKQSNSLADVSFHSPFYIRGQLKLPTLVVDNSTMRMLLNLVVYEMCLPRNQTDNYNPKDLDNSWFTSYVNLLDLLIDTEQDVKDLRAADILQNYLSSDIEVARMINDIGSYCFAPPKDTYAYVKFDIEKHYRRRCAIWIAQVCHAHFSSPLTILALLAAAVVLALTALQAWYAVNPKK